MKIEKDEDKTVMNKCELCNYRTKSERTMERHHDHELNHKKFTCNNCEKTFKTMKGCNNHIQKCNRKLPLPTKLNLKDGLNSNDTSDISNKFKKDLGKRPISSLQKMFPSKSIDSAKKIPSLFTVQRAERDDLPSN